LLAGFFLLNHALATYGFINTANQNDLNGYNYTGQELGTAAQTFTIGSNDAGALVFIKFKKDNSNDGKPFFQIHDITASTWATFESPGAGLCGNVNTSYDGVYQFPLTCPLNALPYTLLQNYEFLAGHSYEFYSGIGSYQAYFYGSSVDTYPNGACVAGYCSGIVDFYFSIGLPLITNSATIDAIADITADNQLNFGYTYHLDNAVKYNGLYTIFPHFYLYQCASASSSTCNTPTSFGWVDNPNWNLNIATGTITGGTIANGYYQVKNFYLKYDNVGNGNLTASTTMVDSNVFQVNYSGNIVPIITIPVMPTGATSTLGIITCDPNDVWYAYSFCKLALWLFIPDQNVLSLFGSLINNIKDKAPIGYFSSISTALNQVGSTSTPAVIIFNPTDNDPVNNTFFSPIRTALIWILWLAFGFWIFERFRHFNLTNP
jgi:hypothetical protein